MYDYLEKNSDYYQNLRKKRQIRNRIFSLTIIIILFVSLWVRNFFEKQDYLPQEAFDGIYWVLFLIEQINFILILLLFMLISREIILLLLEWYRKKTGSHYKAKIVMIFLILAIVPSAFTIYISSRLLKFNIDKWFDINTEKNIEFSQSIADEYIELNRDILASLTHNLAGKIQDDLDDVELVKNKINQSTIFLDNPKFIKGIMLFYNKKAVFSNTTDNFITAYISSLISENEEVFEEHTGQKGRIVSADEYTYILNIHPLSINPHIVLLAYNHLEPAVSAYIDEIYSSASKFEQQSVLQSSIKSYHYYSLMLISILIIFMAVWFGLHFSKEITVPIISLIRGTQEVAAGNFDFEIEKHSGQEIGTLVDSFNAMTKYIKNSRNRLQRANESLEEKTNELQGKTLFIELLIQNISAGILAVALNYKVITVNKAFLNLLGYKEQDFAIRPVDITLKDKYPDIFNIISDTARLNKNEIFQTLTININNNSKTVRITSQILSGGISEDKHILLMIEDISDIIRAEKLTAWKEVARRIAHEIKNPLTPLQLSIQRICRVIDKKAILTEYADFFNENRFILESSVRTIKVLVDEFNRFAKLPSINAVKDDINTLLQEVYTYYSNQNPKISFSLSLQEPLQKVVLDREMMRRAINNIVNNAIDAVKERGEITIASLFDANLDCIAVEIRDNGTGLTKNQKENLFLPYFSTKKEKSGTGLGLSIVLSIVSDHKGYIRVLDNKPRGCIFRIELPYIRDS